MRLRLRTIYAGPHGTAGPGDIIELPPEAARPLLDGGYAELVDRVAPVETATPPAPPETAVVRAPAGRRRHG